MLKRFLKDERGNFAMMFAGASLCIMTCVGVAVDYSTLTSAKQNLQSAVDSAALAGAIVADTNTKKDRKALVGETFQGNNFTSTSMTSKGLTNVNFDDSNSLVTVAAKAEVKSLFLHYLISGAKTVTAQATVSYAVDDVKPIALAFVMDVSGSMDWVVTGDTQKKIDALKDASEELFRAVEKGIGRKSTVEQVLSASLSSYNTALMPAWTTDMQPERSTANGTSTPTGQTARGMIGTLVAAGGTNSTPAVQDAFDKLIAAKALRSNTQAFMLFMTDGDNNDAAEDPNSRAICDQAKAQGIQIFSVAFDAPDKGKSLLLQCASPADQTGAVDASVCDGVTPTKACERQKKGYFFDASDAKKLKRAFKAIGDNIGEQNIVIRS